MIDILINIVWLLVPVLICATYLVYMERRIIGFLQLRIGPNTVGPFGLLQLLADAVKLATKEFILPSNIKAGGFLLAPVITFSLALAGWAVIPTKFTADAAKLEYVAHAVADINFGVLYFVLISGLGVYGIVIAGWASGSRYAFLGSMRAVAQMISYELVMGMAISSVVLCAGSFNFLEIVDRLHLLPILTKLMLFPMAVVFFISILAETKRHPFDLPEAESELVSGYNVEYSSMPFAMFFFGEYANMILTSAVMAMLFMGGWHPPLAINFLYHVPGLFWFGLKIFFILFCFVWVRATLPRYRYDQLMHLCWARLLPLSFLWLMLLAFLLAKKVI